MHDNELAVVIITDITKLKKYEKQKQIDKFKTIYFASVAHDLRTPLNSMIGTNELLIMQLEGRPQCLQFLEIN